MRTLPQVFMEETPGTIAAIQPLSMRKIAVFWAPLASTWLMMAVEGPLLAALIARLVDPKFNLAAYGVAFSLALIVEAPVIMMMSASNALVEDRSSYLKLRNFNFTIIAGITVFMLVLIIPDVFSLLAVRILSLPEPVAGLTHKATMLLLPWPGAIGYRRFNQGIMIRGNRTRSVAFGTIIRLACMSSTAFMLFYFKEIDGAAVGAMALSVGVTVEAIASRFMVRKSLRSLFREIQPESSDKKTLGYRAIFRFYYPLAMMSFLALGIQPVIIFFMGKSSYAIESLAVLPVINSLVFIFRCVGLSFQDVAIANLGERCEQFVPLRRFAVILGSSATVILAVIAFSPLSGIWFKAVSGLSVDLASFAILPLQVQVVIPATAVLLQFQHAVLVRTRRTFPVTIGMVIEVLGVILLLMLTIRGFGMVGAVAASVALVFARLAANAYLFVPGFRALRRVQTAGTSSVSLPAPTTQSVEAKIDSPVWNPAEESDSV